MNRKIMLLGLALVLGGCAVVKPMSEAEMAASGGDEMKPGPGLLSGASGEFTLRLP